MDRTEHQGTCRRRAGGLYVTAATVAVGLLATTGATYAALNASATASGNVTTGILSLVLDSGGASLTQPVTDLMPGDVLNRHVTLVNGAIPAQDLQLAVTAAPTTLLTTDATKGLQMLVRRCTVPWDSQAGTCGGDVSVLQAASPLATAAQPQLLPSVGAGEQVHLQIGLVMPDTSETTVNGAPPPGTVQGLSTSLTFTFTEVQRAGKTTNT